MTGTIVAMTAAGCGDRGNRSAGPVEASDRNAVVDSSARYASRMANDLGFVEEGRFLAGKVVILDRYEPYLKLFRPDGVLLWAGGRAPGRTRNAARVPLSGGAGSGSGGAHSLLRLPQPATDDSQVRRSEDQ